MHFKFFEKGLEEPKSEEKSSLFRPQQCWDWFRPEETCCHLDSSERSTAIIAMKKPAENKIATAAVVGEKLAKEKL